MNYADRFAPVVVLYVVRWAGHPQLRSGAPYGRSHPVSIIRVSSCTFRLARSRRCSSVIIRDAADSSLCGSGAALLAFSDRLSSVSSPMQTAARAIRPFLCAFSPNAPPIGRVPPHAQSQPLGLSPSHPPARARCLGHGNPYCTRRALRDPFSHDGRLHPLVPILDPRQ